MNWKAVRLIATRELRERTRSRVFRLGTTLTVLVVVAAVVFPVLAAGGDHKPTYRIGHVGSSAPELDRAIRNLGPSLGGDAVVQNVESREAGESLLRSQLLDVLVVPREALVTRVALDPNVGTNVGQVASAVAEVLRLYDGLASVGVNATSTSEALKQPALPLVGLESPPKRNAGDANSASSGMILLFVFLTLYGAFILNGVIEEKTSRVVEILLSTVRPNELLIGKVLGIGLVGTIQGSVLVIATFLTRASIPNASSNALTPAVIGYTMLWFAIGFGIYAWMYACAGALVSRSEDAQNLVFPLQIPLVASYGAGLIGSISGPNPVLNAMSFIPFTAPMTMLERMAAQQVALWEVILSISLCLITMYFTMRLAIVIFAGGILRSGQRVRLREAWRNPAG